MKRSKYFTKKRVYALALAAVMANSMLGYGSGLVAHAEEGSEEVTCEHTIETVAIQEATCGEDGVSAHYKCTVCEKLFSDEAGETETTLEALKIEATGNHTGGTATCEAKAVCEVCEQEYGELADHTGGEATCKDKAVCEVCEQEYGELATEHTIETVAIQEATCGEDGVSAHYKCTVCEKLFSDEAGETETTLEALKIEATGEHAGGEATCESKAVCTTCGQEYGELAEHTYSELVAQEDATCDEDGTKAHYTCENCDSVFVDGEEEGTKEEVEADSLVIPATGHDYKEVADTAKEPTCTEAGKEADQKCSVCEDVKTGAEIKATGHGEAVADKDSAVAPTCTEAGKEADMVCPDCDAVITEGKKIEATGHDYESKVTKEPTTEAEGEKTYTCKDCGDTYTEKIDKLPVEEDKEEDKTDEEEGKEEDKTDEEEEVKEGLTTLEDGSVVFYEEDGKLATDKWVDVDGTWYYFDEEGVALTGWQEIDGAWYYFNEDGTMAADEWVDDYYVAESGAWMPNAVEEKWIAQDGKWWYQNVDGSYPANKWELIDDEWYYFDASGWMETGWILDGNTWYYLNASGAMATGWILDGNTWYYLNESGAMATGWVEIIEEDEEGEEVSTWYYMNESGAMQTGWELVGGTWYYLNASGAMATGWLFDGNAWYYLDESGAMLYDTVVDGYTLDKNGAWVQ